MGQSSTKALLVRYGVGTDSGLSQMRNLLINTLEWDAKDVEMLYYNTEQRGQNATCTTGQQAPTARRFKEKLKELLQDAKSGDVRFLYVDAHGSSLEDPNSDESDKRDEGWKLAQDEDGRAVEIVYDDHLSTIINQNLHYGVNFTILTSSCLGGGMLDAYKGTNGVLLAACHESQTNIKALAGKDPWTLAIIHVISEKRKTGSLPTYETLFAEAKQYIVQKMMKAPAWHAPKYLGPSPDPSSPLPRNPVDNSSHQDPQLVYRKGYLQVDVERFLTSFTTLQDELGSLATGVVAPQPGSIALLTYETVNDWHHVSPGATISAKLSCGIKGHGSPIVLTGVNMVDMGNTKESTWNLRIRTFADDVSEDFYTVHAKTWYKSILYNSRISVLLYANNQTQLDGGNLHVIGKKRIYFARAFKRPPIVYVGLSGWDISDNWRINVETMDIKETCFEVDVTTWGSSILHGAWVTWIAYDPKQCECFSGVIGGNGKANWSGLETFGRQLSRRPQMFTALTRFDVSHFRNFRLKVSTKPTEQGFKWEMITWSDTELYGVKASWLAICL